MHRLPEEAFCDECGALATLELWDTAAQRNCTLCGVHRPKSLTDREGRFVVMRNRSLPDGPCSRALASDRESAEHRNFREEMCDLRLLSGNGACRYYLSILTEIDHFALWSNEYVENLREFVLAATHGKAECFRFDGDTVGFMAPLLEAEYRKRFSLASAACKADRAVELRLRHPEWSDEEVATAVPTTVKQLQRFSHYKISRTSQFLIEANSHSAS